MTEQRIRELSIWGPHVRIEPLGGGITNLNFKVSDGDHLYAARTGEDDPRLGIDRFNELQCTILAAEHGIAPAIRYFELGVLVSEFIAGTPLTPEIIKEQKRIPVVTHEIRRIHELGQGISGHFAYFSPFQVCRTSVEDALEHDLELPGPDCAELMEEIQELQSRIAAFHPTFCHNDPMPGNFLDTGERVWVIDWEYAGMGHALFDLAGLSSNCAFEPEHDELMLTSYYGEVPDAVTTQLPVMKAIAALRESLWAVVQGSQSLIEFDYDGYRDENFDKYRRAVDALD